MDTAAKISLVLTDTSSLKRVADSQAAISYGGFYQQLVSQLVRGAHTRQVLLELGERLVGLAEHSYAFRQIDVFEQVSQILISLPLPRQFEAVGRYYQALCIHRLGRGDVERAKRLLERVAEDAPPRYRAKAMLSMGSMSVRVGDNQSALSLYGDAARFASRSNIYDPYVTLGTQKMAAVIEGLEGNHRDAVALLENLYPLAHAMRSSQTSVYYDYLNGLAVELCEVGRLEEAKNVSQIVLASPFASAYPEWRETRDEIELKGWRAPRSVAAISHRTSEAKNLVRMPAREAAVSLGTESYSYSDSARVLSMQDWKKRMPKKSNGDTHDKITAGSASILEKPASLKELENLTTRDKLLRIMDLIGDERVGDDLLLRALIILEGIEPDENQGT